MPVCPSASLTSPLWPLGIIAGGLWTDSIDTSLDPHNNPLRWVTVTVLVTKLCPTLCDPMDCSLPGSSAHGTPVKNTGVGCHPLLQGIFPTQGSNLGLSHSRQILYHLSQQGSCSNHHRSRKLLNGALKNYIWGKAVPRWASLVAQM